MGWEDDLKAAIPRGLAREDDRVPGAFWADPKQLGPAWNHKRTSIFLGYRDGKGIGNGDDRHLMVVAGSRAGKGLSFVVPNLLLYEGSVLATDPKGELAQLTANSRKRKGQAVYVLDPFDTSGRETHSFRASFNPLTEIDPASRTVIDDASLLADALIVLDDGGGEKFWTYAARELVKLLILNALTLPKEQRHLGAVRDFFLAPPEEPGISAQISFLAKIAEKENAFDGLVSGMAFGFMGRNDKEFTSIVSNADVQTEFLDSIPLRECSKTSSFSLSELMRDKTTLYMCLPATRMSTHAKWFRMIVTMALLMCERVKVKPNPPMLMLLDEFPVLGYMQPIEMAAGLIAGFGVKICTVLQDLTQLQRYYGKSWETFIGNSGVTVFFGNSDATTLEYVSKKLGTIGYDLQRASRASVESRMGGAPAIEEQFQLSRLLEPHEVEMLFAREHQRALVLYPGRPPLIVSRADFRTDEGLKKLL